MIMELYEALYDNINLRSEQEYVSCLVGCSQSEWLSFVVLDSERVRSPPQRR